MALSNVAGDAPAAPTATIALPCAAGHAEGQEAPHVKLGGPGVPARARLVSTATGRDRGLVVLHEKPEGQGRRQQATVQKPASGGQVELSVRRHTRAPFGVLLIITSRGPRGALEKTYLGYDGKRNRINRVLATLGSHAPIQARPRSGSA